MFINRQGVWIAPVWQEQSWVCRLGVCSHVCQAFACGFQHLETRQFGEGADRLMGGDRERVLASLSQVLRCWQRSRPRPSTLAEGSRLTSAQIEAERDVLVRVNPVEALDRYLGCSHGGAGSTGGRGKTFSGSRDGSPWA